MLARCQVGLPTLEKDTENRVRLAVEDLNAQALVIGGKKIKFELAAEDDAGDHGKLLQLRRN